MRVAFDPQLRFGSTPVLDVRLNTACRDQIIPLLAARQHIDGRPERRDDLLEAVAPDVNGTCRADRGRPGLTDWQVLVLAAVRLGGNLDDDKLQNLAAAQRSLGPIMGLGGGEEDETFDGRRLRDNICVLAPDPIEPDNHVIMAQGHRLVAEAAEAVRGDSVVVATDIHSPTDSGLIGDGLRQIVPQAVRLADRLGGGGGRQPKHLLRVRRRQRRVITKSAAGKGRAFQQRLRDGSRVLLDLADRLRTRTLERRDPGLIVLSPGEEAARVNALRTELTDSLDRTIRVGDLARRRGLPGETIEQGETLFRLCAPQTPLIVRGKVRQPVACGHRVLILEDGTGVVCPSAIQPHGAADRDVWVGERKQLQERLKGRIRRASFDRGFPSPETQRALAEWVAPPCLPQTGRLQAERQEREATVAFHRTRRRHGTGPSGGESDGSGRQTGRNASRSNQRSII